MSEVRSQDGAIGQLANPWWVPLLLSIVAMLLLLSIAYFVRSDPKLYRFVMSVIVGLCAGAVANAFIVGYFEVKSKGVSAGGTFAVFVFTVGCGFKMLP